MSKKYVICDDCPCMSSDYETGGSCNLEYDCDLKWFDKKTRKQVEDTPEMRSHQNDFELSYASLNCKLISIETADKKIYRSDFKHGKEKN